MTENQKKILEMLSQNKISTDDAYRLLNVIESEEGGQEGDVKAEPDGKTKPKYMRVTVLPDPDSEHTDNVDRVNVRVPMSLIRAGIKLTSLIPSEAMEKVNDTLREKGINGFPLAQTEVVLTFYLPRAFFLADAAAGAPGLNNIARFLPDNDLKFSCLAAYLYHLGVGQQLDIGM